MYLRLLLYFLNLRWCRIFFSVSFDGKFFGFLRILLFQPFFLSIQSVWSILLSFSLIVLPQNITIWFINAKGNPFLEYHLLIPGRDFLLFVQERVAHLSKKFYFWCIWKGNLYLKHTLQFYLNVFRKKTRLS